MPMEELGMLSPQERMFGISGDRHGWGGYGGRSVHSGIIIIVTEDGGLGRRQEPVIR